jgi:hypothetical protein
MTMNKTQFNIEAERIINETRSGLNGMSDRQVRITAIKNLTEAYTAANGERPASETLERLTDAILHEELTDNNEHKVAHTEYPFLSDTQIARRQEGKHRRKTDNPKFEVPLMVAENIGQDGKDYRYPTRKKRGKNDALLRDKNAQIRNKEIALRYREFTGEQEVITKATMSPDEIEAYLGVKYTEYQRKFARGLR